MIVVFFAAGCLELVSILFRPVSLSFRLYGNIFAGETMLETMARVPHIGWLVQMPFYFLELLVGAGSGAGVHAVDRGVHAADLSASRGRICRRARLKERGDIWAICTSDSRRSARPLAVGAIGMKASEAVGRNPGAATQVMVQSILAIAFAEAIVFYTLFLVK